MFNLITDAWIPVRRLHSTDIIRPDQIAEADVLFPDWPRPDLNLACLELLVGLIYLACPPCDPHDWRSRTGDQQALRDALAPLAPAFNLLGDGPRFMQDFEPISGKRNPPDFLLIDSAGAQSVKRNSDVMVKRSRYTAMELPLAAIALFTLQDFAPAGGAGNRTSMRGGGPMVTLVQPETPGLWQLVWANVPEGEPLQPDELDELPWMRPTETSKNNEVVTPPDGYGPPPPEVFFGMPRRLRLVENDGKLTFVHQVPSGTNYAGWLHPLSPYYHIKNEKLPKHPKPGPYGYRNWRGIVLQSEDATRPACLTRFLRERPGEKAKLLIGGWAMSNMSPLDFLWSEQPVFPLSDGGEAQALALVEAAEQAAFALAANTRDAKGEADAQAGAAARAREAFYAKTQTDFERLVARISAGDSAGVQADWVAVLRRTALALFDAEVLPGLADLQETRRQKAVTARRNLLFALTGWGGIGKKLFGALGLPLPKRKEETA
jgi:CRISPR system Cascade subunit CasA